MAYKKYNFEAIIDCDDDENYPTCWALTMTDENGKNHFIWISRYDDEYKVEDSKGYNIGSVTYKTLAGAKRRAKELARYQEFTQYFTD